jgi:hypothetical protein
VLNETFGTHLLMVHMDGQAYAYQHHAHQDAPAPAVYPDPPDPPDLLQQE